jgi:hypothetical protein
VRDKDDLNLLIDSALQTYAEPGDEAGVVRRVLGRVAEARVSGQSTPRPSWRWMKWAIALPAAACVLLLVIRAPNPPHTPASRAKQSHPAQQRALITPHTGSQPASRSESLQRSNALAMNVQLRSVTAAALPKLDVFPTPHPLTPAEQALAAMARQTPTPELQALAGTQTQTNVPVSIAAIHFPPLEPPDPGQN